MLGTFAAALFIPALLASPLLRDGKIVGGTNALNGSYPYQVAILQASGIIYCGASIITESLLLTAAHCEMTNLANFRALAGSIDCYDYGRDINGRPTTGQLRLISKFTKHQSYDNVFLRNDIALVKVTQPFVFNSNVKAVTLSTTTAYPTGTVTATGWGRTINGDNDSIPDILQTVDLTVVSYSTCATKWGGIPSNVVCASAVGKDACQGDSGGPLVQRVNNEFVQVGITSFGAACADPNHPGVYTQVSKFIGWINYMKPQM